MLATKNAGRAASHFTERRNRNRQSECASRQTNRLGFCLLAILALAGCAQPGPHALLAGKRLLEADQPAQAVGKLKLAVQLMATNAQAWNYLGLAHHHAGQPVEAIQAYDRAIRLDPNLAEARYNIGVVQLEQNQVSGAIAALTSFTVLQPQAAHGWRQLGAAHLRARQIDLAERSLQQALKINPKLAPAINDLGLIAHQKRRYVESANHFATALQAQPGYSPAMLNLAIVSHQYLNRRSFALGKYREFAALDPGSPWADPARAVAGLLEREINPPPPIVTNTLSAASTNAANVLSNRVATSGTSTPVRAATTVPVVTNPPATATASNTSTSKTEPLPTIPSKSKPSTSPDTQTAAPPKVQVVQIKEDEPVALAPGPAVDNRRPVAAASKSVPPPITRPPEQPPDTSSETATDNRAGRPGLGDRLNPKNWFRSREKPPTPLPSPGTKSTSPSTRVATVRNNPPPTLPSSPPPVTEVKSPDATPLPPRPSYARYSYRSPTPRPLGKPQEARVYLSQGIQAYQGRRWTAAMEAFRRAGELDPGSFEAHYNLGLASLEAGNLPLSMAAYEEALAIDPTSHNARYNFALALRQGNYPQDAANELEKIVRDQPSDARVRFTAANLYAQQLFQNEKARQHYLKVLEIEPRHPQATAIRYWLAGNP